MLGLGPLISLIPDVTLIMAQRLFWPSPTDAVMRMQKENPTYEYDGFPEEQALKEKERHE